MGFEGRAELLELGESLALGYGTATGIPEFSRKETPYSICIGVGAALR